MPMVRRASSNDPPSDAGTASRRKDLRAAPQEDGDTATATTAPGAPAARDGWSLGARLPARRFSRDEGGALLILTGVLLVLGFVIIGTTLVQLNVNADKTTRAQRDPLLETVDSLVKGFTEGIAATIEIGETNTAQFNSISENQEEILRDTATAVGIYADLSLHPNPTTSMYAGPTKCEVYEPAYTANGIVFGYEKATLQESIVGAVYSMEFTDGKQSVKMDHYVKIHECTGGILSTFPAGVKQNMGSATVPLDALKNSDDEHASVLLTEELTGSTILSETAGVTVTGLSPQWNSPGKVEDEDGQVARHPAIVSPNHLRSRIDIDDLSIPTLAPPVVINDLTIRVDANDRDGPLTNDDRLHLFMYEEELAPLPFFPYKFPDLTVSEATYMVPIGDSPSGNPEWTAAELEAAMIEMMVVDEGTHDPSHEFDIEYLEAHVTFASAEKHALEIEFEWDPDLPPIYTDHDLVAVYMIDAATAGEEFQFQVCQPPLDANDNCVTWVDLGPPLTDTAGAWADWGPVTVDPAYHNDNEPLFRLVDKTPDDNQLTDRDVILFDYLALQSIVDP